MRGRKITSERQLTSERGAAGLTERSIWTWSERQLDLMGEAFECGVKGSWILCEMRIGQSQRKPDYK